MEVLTSIDLAKMIMCALCQQRHAWVARNYLRTKLPVFQERLRQHVYPYYHTEQALEAMRTGGLAHPDDLMEFKNRAFGAVQASVPADLVRPEDVPNTADVWRALEQLAAGSLRSIAVPVPTGKRIPLSWWKLAIERRALYTVLHNSFQNA